MPRRYTVEFESVAKTTTGDLIELKAATDHPIELYGLFLSQSTEVGDAQDEMIRYQVVRGNTSSGTGGATPTRASARRRGHRRELQPRDQRHDGRLRRHARQRPLGQLQRPRRRGEVVA